MKHYKITKKTYYGIDDNGDLTEQVKFKPYKRVLWFFWSQLKTAAMYCDASSFVRSIHVAYNNIEEAESFIHKYHKIRDKVDSYTIETVEKINLKD